MNFKRSKLVKIIYNHIENNIKEYFIVTLIFLIGILLGVFFVNNISETELISINEYVSNIINKMKSVENINNYEIIKISLSKNIIISILIWFFGTTVIGIPIVFGIILYKGFSLGYTISIFTKIYGIKKGIIINLSSLLCQNIIFIPSLLALGVSGIKLYKSIVKNKEKENIKLEIIRHTFFSLIMLLLTLMSSLIEVFLSTNILKMIIKYF